MTRRNSLDDLDWVVWDLLVWDPKRLVEPGIGERTSTAMTELAGTLGCVFVQCGDDDDVDGVAYYSWLVRIPRKEHLRHNNQGTPIAIATLHAHLRRQLPVDLHDWDIHPDVDRSLRGAAGRILRHAYSDLLDPLEVALLGLRRDGAETLDPEAKYWWGDDSTIAGDYALWLCKDPEPAVRTFPPWLIVKAGLTADDDFWVSHSGQGLRLYGIKPGSPILLLPRPDECQWLVTVTTTTFLTPATARHPRAVGASHRWTSRDGRDLAHRVAGDLKALIASIS